MSKDTEDVLELLDSLEGKGTSGMKRTKKKKAPDSNVASNGKDDDIMGFLDSLAKPSVNSGRSTPNPVSESKETTTGGAGSVGGTTEAKTNEAEVAEPPATQATESPARATDSPEDEVMDPIGSLTSWWSKNKDGLWNSAATAVKQAEAKVRELQPEVQHSQQQVMTNLTDKISKIGLNRSLLQSTISSVLETIVPPINRHEQLKIHIFHDMVGYGAIDNIVYSVFDNVMQQVEGGGDLQMIIQKGKERHRRGSNKEQERNLNLFKGTLEQGTSLAAANIEDFVRERKRNTSEAKDTSGNDTGIRISNIFLSIQPVATETDVKTELKTTMISMNSPSTFYFIIYLLDPDNDVSFTTASQPFPYQWAEWLDSPDSKFDHFDADPREWVNGWVEEGLGLAVGIVAQSYVAKRMAVDTVYAIANTQE